jgi:hypothetical protein
MNLHFLAIFVRLCAGESNDRGTAGAEHADTLERARHFPDEPVWLGRHRNSHHENRGSIPLTARPGAFETRPAHGAISTQAKGASPFSRDRFPGCCRKKIVEYPGFAIGMKKINFSRLKN